MEPVSPDPATLDGMAQLAALKASGRRPPMIELVDVELVEFKPGLAVFEGSSDRRFYNPIGSVHDGYAATLLDSACGIAVHTRMAAGQGYTTLELKVAYHRPLTDRSGTVRAEGKVVSMGRRAAFAEARLFDDERRLCASATSSLLVFDLLTRGDNILKGPTMLKLLATTVFILAMPALAQRGGPIRVTLAAPVTQNGLVKATATSWSCAGTSCTGPEINGRFGDARGCREIAKAAGAVAVYAGAKGELSADDLARCNKSAKMPG